LARWLELLPLDELLRRPAPRNPKKHLEQGIRESITRHGFVEAPTIDERTGRLVAGHGRLNDLAERHKAGEEPPEGVELSEDGTWMVPVQRGWASRTDQDAEAFVIAANALTIAGGWDEDMLAEMLRDYQDEPDWLAGTGYDEKSIVSFLASTGSLSDDDAAPDQSALLTHQQAVMVECADDEEQRLLIERLTKEGYTCRALNT
jgi:hypothetical protein